MKKWVDDKYTHISVLLETICLARGNGVPEKSQSIYFQPLANRRLRSLSTKAVCFSYIMLVYYPANIAPAGNFQQLFGSVAALPAIVEVI